MASPTAVNGQITDAVTQTNTKVLGEAPAMAAGALYQAMAGALSLQVQNAVATQQQAQILAQSTTTCCVKALVGTPENLAAAAATP